MYKVYFLFSEKDGGIYIGRTIDLLRRLAEHRRGEVPATRPRRPLRLLGYDVCNTETESVALEKEWKKGYKREELKKRFKLKDW